MLIAVICDHSHRSHLGFPNLGKKNHFPIHQAMNLANFVPCRGVSAGVHARGRARPGVTRDANARNLLFQPRGEYPHGPGG